MKHVCAFISSVGVIGFAFAIGLWLTPSAARAAPVDYVFSPGSFVVLGPPPICMSDPACTATYGSGADKEAISGSFTYDASTETVSNASVVLIGASPYSGTYNSGPTPFVSSGFPLLLSEAGQDPTDLANMTGGASLAIFLPLLPDGTAAMNVQQLFFESEFPGDGNVAVSTQTSSPTINFLSASIEPSPTPNFALIENVAPCPPAPSLPTGILNAGCFTLINNTSNYSITGFEVGNSDALFDATTRSNWSAALASVDYGNGPEQSFDYFDLGGSGANALGNGSDDSFFFSTTLLGSVDIHWRARTVAARWIIAAKLVSVLS